MDWNKVKNMRMPSLLQYGTTNFVLWPVSIELDAKLVSQALQFQSMVLRSVWHDQSIRTGATEKIPGKHIRGF